MSAQEPPVLASGDLARHHLAVLLYELGARELDGVVQLVVPSSTSPEPQRVCVYFEGGAPVGTDYRAHEFMLGHVMMQEGWIDPGAYGQSLHALAEATNNVSAAYRLQGKILRELGAIDEEGLIDGLELQLEQQLLALFGVHGAPFEVLGGVRDEHTVATTRPPVIGVPAVIAQGVARAFEGSPASTALVAAEGSRVQACLREEARDALEFFELDEQRTAALLHLVGVPLPLSELVDALGDRQGARAALYALWATELLEVGDGLRPGEPIVWHPGPEAGASNSSPSFERLLMQYMSDESAEPGEPDSARAETGGTDAGIGAVAHRSVRDGDAAQASEPPLEALVTELEQAVDAGEQQPVRSRDRPKTTDDLLAQYLSGETPIEPPTPSPEEPRADVRDYGLTGPSQRALQPQGTGPDQRLMSRPDGGLRRRGTGPDQRMLGFDADVDSRYGGLTGPSQRAVRPGSARPSADRPVDPLGDAPTPVGEPVYELSDAPSGAAGASADATGPSTDAASDDLGSLADLARLLPDGNTPPPDMPELEMPELDMPELGEAPAASAAPVRTHTPAAPHAAAAPRAFADDDGAPPPQMVENLESSIASIVRSARALGTGEVEIATTVPKMRRRGPGSRGRAGPGSRRRVGAAGSDPPTTGIGHPARHDSAHDDHVIEAGARARRDATGRRHSARRDATVRGDPTGSEEVTRRTRVRRDSSGRHPAQRPDEEGTNPGSARKPKRGLIDRFFKKR